MDRNICVLGSCRINQPIGTDPHFLRFSGGYTHTSKRALQTISIMRGDLVVPDYLRKYVFKWKHSNKSDNREDLSSIKKYIIEISSVKNIYEINTGLHFAIHFRIHRYKISSDIEVEDYDESPEQTISNLNMILNNVDGKDLCIVSHNNIAGIKKREKLINLLSGWCKENDVSFFNPTLLIRMLGGDRCFQKRRDAIDTNHYTDFMKESMKKFILRYLV